MVTATAFSRPSAAECAAQATVARAAGQAAAPGPALQPVAGFEASGYAWQAGQIVWVGRAGDERDAQRRDGAAHPRNLRRPWHAPSMAFDAARLREGARITLGRLEAGRVAGPTGLLRWLAGRAMPFPLSAARPRFDALSQALAQDDPAAFAAAAPRVLGLGPGLTPSGDDFLGGAFFALAHAPRQRWAAALPALRARLLHECQGATNPISAALLADAMHGRSYRALHELLAALQAAVPASVDGALSVLGGIGATSGGDLAAGVLVALATTPLPTNPAPAPPMRRAAHCSPTPSR